MPGPTSDLLVRASGAQSLLVLVLVLGPSVCGAITFESYDSYRGIKKLMKWAKGVSVKDQVWDDEGNRMPLDFDRMLRIVLDAGYHGYCGIEFGGYANLAASRKKLEESRKRLAG